MSTTKTDTRPQIIWVNVVFLTLTPLLAITLVPWFCWTQEVSWAQVISATCLWLATGLAITAGYHRLFSHRAYKASAPVRLTFALLGGMFEVWTDART